MNDGLSGVQLVTLLKKDIDTVCRGLLTAFEITFSEANADAGAATARWLDYRARYIEPCPREIVLSDRFPKSLPDPVEQGYRDLLEKFRSGADVNPHQSKTLTGHKRPGPRFRTDMLFADWGMFHFHLDDEPLPPGARYTKRSAWLAFCFVTPTQVAVVDVVPHPDRDNKEFSDPDLLNTAIRSWPETFEHLKVRGPTPHPPMTMDQIHALRTNSANAFFSFDGQAYMSPGGGYMGNKTRMGGYMRLVVLTRDMDALAKSLNDPSDQFRRNAYVAAADAPVFSMKIHEHGIGIHERTSGTFFGPTAIGEVDVYGLRGLSELLLPEWAMVRVRAMKSTVFDALFCERPALDG
jgi:hypothetical protein